MGTSKIPPIEGENADISPDENQDGAGNNKADNNSLGKTNKYAFPFNGGIFSEAARRRKAAKSGKDNEPRPGLDFSAVPAYQF